MSKKHYTYEDLKKLMKRLRDKDNGCPWDIEQDFHSIKPHTIEEAYEVADAIERNDMDDLKDELGDLLFQTVFHAQIASEKGHFDLDDVIHHVVNKMIFRHPHVFENNGKKVSYDHVEKVIWESQKKKEKGTTQAHYLEDITPNLPSLLLAHKIQKRLYKIDFRFPSILAILDKLNEEIEELKEAYEGDNNDHIAEEIGDILFVAALLGTDTKNPPEETLQQACHKFIERFNRVEDYLKKEGLSLQDASTEEMSRAWFHLKAHKEKLS